MAGENQTISDVVHEMYAECRANTNIYSSPTGIELKVGDTGWLVTYWPASDSNAEQLTLNRDWPQLLRPASYILSTNGHCSKNETVKEREPGGVFFDPKGERAVTDIGEVFILQAVLKAAHHLKRT